jgi:hypothetical protein
MEDSGRHSLAQVVTATLTSRVWVWHPRDSFATVAFSPKTPIAYGVMSQTASNWGHYRAEA